MGHPVLDPVQDSLYQALCCMVVMVMPMRCIGTKNQEHSQPPDTGNPEFAMIVQIVRRCGEESDGQDKVQCGRMTNRTKEFRCGRGGDETQEW